MEQQVKIPQELLEAFSENGLSLPPLPGVAMPFLHQVGDYAFSTHDDWEPVAGRYVVFTFPEFAAMEKRNPEEETAVRFHCGFDGYGIQNWTFRYVLEAPTLEMGFVLPYGTAYGNAQAQSKKIEQSYDLIQGCLAVTQCGTFFGQHKEALLRVTLDAEGFHYSLVDKDGSVIQEGDRLDAFLDLLTVWGDGEAGQGAQAWTMV